LEFYRRRLPHLHIIGQPLFITFRLFDSLPRNRFFSNDNLTSGQAFVVMDSLLDLARTGPVYMRKPEIADIAVRSIKHGAEPLKYYDCHAFVVMPNHVHLLITPHVAVPKLLGGLKSASAKEANILLGRAGKPFWQKESFDRLVRTPDEFRRIRRYIEQNPVKAGLAREPEEYEWSSVASPQNSS